MLHLPAGCFDASSNADAGSVTKDDAAAAAALLASWSAGLRVPLQYHQDLALHGAFTSTAGRTMDATWSPRQKQPPQMKPKSMSSPAKQLFADKNHVPRHKQPQQSHKASAAQSATAAAFRIAADTSLTSAGHEEGIRADGAAQAHQQRSSHHCRQESMQQQQQQLEEQQPSEVHGSGSCSTAADATSCGSDFTGEHNKQSARWDGTHSMLSNARTGVQSGKDGCWQVCNRRMTMLMLSLKSRVGLLVDLQFWYMPK